LVEGSQVAAVVVDDTRGVAVGFAGTTSQSDAAVWIIVDSQ
jgi:deoxycytidylate deaminase